MEIKKVDYEKDSIVVDYLDNGIRHKVYFRNEKEFKRWKETENYSTKMKLFVWSIFGALAFIFGLGIYTLFNILFNN